MASSRGMVLAATLGMRPEYGGIGGWQGTPEAAGEKPAWEHVPKMVAHREKETSLSGF